MPGIKKQFQMDRYSTVIVREAEKEGSPWTFCLILLVGFFVDSIDRQCITGGWTHCPTQTLCLQALRT
jgi:hypothetical protein